MRIPLFTGRSSRNKSGSKLQAQEGSALGQGGRPVVNRENGRSAFLLGEFFSYLVQRGRKRTPAIGITPEK